ncbi:MAG: exosortase/archaeosortase family protein [Halobacteriota archaeon]|nr:exosortase/archaeosortase family protein [Halobacteriota archaeon]
MKSERLVVPLSIAVLIILLYFRTFTWLIESWVNNPYYSHGFLVPLISGYFIYKKQGTLNGIEREPKNIGILLLILGLLMHGMGQFWTVKFLSGFSLIVVIVGLILLIYGSEAMKSLLFPVLFLAFMVPIPPSFIFSFEMQTFSSAFATDLVNLFGITAVNAGSEIHLENCSFTVGAPCSGLRSIISLMSLGAIFSYIHEGSNISRFSVVLSAIPIAIFANILRISSILAIADIYGSDVAMSFFHNFSGLLFFGLALLMLFAVGRWLGRLKVREDIF